MSCSCGLGWADWAGLTCAEGSGLAKRPLNVSMSGDGSGLGSGAALKSRGGCCGSDGLGMGGGCHVWDHGAAACRLDGRRCRRVDVVPVGQLAGMGIT